MARGQAQARGEVDPAGAVARLPVAVAVSSKDTVEAPAGRVSLPAKPQETVTRRGGSTSR